MPYLAIIRHGQSEWNLQNRFTGGADVDLTPQGIEEARKAGELLQPYPFDHAYTSVLTRSIHTLQIILEQTGQRDLPATHDAALNERGYGDLQGLDKAAMARKYSDEQVLIWRRSYDVCPPGGESLKNTYDRIVPYFVKNIEPELKAGKNILIVAHGNSLRALMMHLENISPEAIADVNLATGIPRLYRYNERMELLSVSYLGGQ